MKKLPSGGAQKKGKINRSSLINRLCQNSCKINRLWKSRVKEVLAFRRVAESSVAESRIVREADSRVAQSSRVAEC